MKNEGGRCGAEREDLWGTEAPARQGAAPAGAIPGTRWKSQLPKWILRRDSVRWHVGENDL